MNLSKKVTESNEARLNTTPSKVTTLNPNAAAFIPFSLRSTSAGSSTSTPDGTARFANSRSLGKAVLDRTQSSVSNNSDDEVHQYWRHQLPDDITPDFNAVAEDDSQSLDKLSLAGLSLNDGTQSLGYNGNHFMENLRFSGSSYGEELSPVSLLQASARPWEKQVVGRNLVGNGGEGPSFDGNSRHGFNMIDMMGEQVITDDGDMNPVELLALQFPGFAAESVAEVYFANGGDLNHTIEMLTQLELHVDAGFNQSQNTKTLSAPNLTPMDFPVLNLSDNQNGQPKYTGEDLQQTLSPYHSLDKTNTLFFKSSSSFPSSSGSIDFASAVQKLASQDSGIWKSNRNSYPDVSIGLSRSLSVIDSAYSSGHERSIYGDGSQNRSSARTAPVWLETGEAVASMYSEQREEAREHARLRNAYFEQARQAYLIGNKALAKELSAKGQMHNSHMKTAHGKAQESIYRQRNPVGPDIQGNGRGQERMIDLHGLHVSEAIHVLKHELSVLRSTARAAEQRLQVFICIGTGHHTRGSRTPARLPVAVQKYLLEEEGLGYTEPQPGLLRVVIY